MYNIAVLEDNEQDACILRGYIDKYAKENQLSVKTEWFSDPLKFFNTGKPMYDIIFMDVRMPHMDGLAAAKKLRQFDEKTQIIFITNYAQMAIGGYEVNAFDFVVKPIKYAGFAMRMQRVLALIEKEKEHYIMIPLPYGTMRAAVSAVNFIDVQGHMLYFHTNMGVIETRGKLSDYETMLARYGFLRCSKCALINIKCIDRLTENSIVIKDDVIQISRSKRKVIFDKLKLSVFGKVFSFAPDADAHNSEEAQ